MKIALLEKYSKTRMLSAYICKPLAIEDYVVQPIAEVSPPKWHLAHTTWFFEQFILVHHLADYKVFHSDFTFLFNSYYNNIGALAERFHRGFITRPTVEEVYAYRKYVDVAMQKLLTQSLSQEVLDLVEIGINHEQQHQELLAYDIKYILGNQPTFPALGKMFSLNEVSQTQQWVEIAAGVYEIGADEQGFSYDNERPKHSHYLHPFSISNRLVTNGEFIEFVEDGGYNDFNLWYDEAWHHIKAMDLQQPLYWHKNDGLWQHFTFQGLEQINPLEPIMHLSFYEAAAFAEWKGMRLPTEFEWEVASSQFQWGQLWEWTNSAYLPYPGFHKVEGALGEYNGKFMLNQIILRGASIATPEYHARKTYRNFFHASSRWIFSGVRLAKKNIKINE